MSFPTLLSISDMRSQSRQWQEAQKTVAFVPTMGALHEGHLALLSEARKHADRVVVSIFVNPLQFGPSEDFSRYPRTLSADIEKLQAAGIDALFVPNASEIYPSGFQTNVQNNIMSKGLCGRFRPGHFDGVLTVVLKLLHIVSPTVALFGKKDYQQWRVIDRMTQDLCIPVSVIGCPTLRESDGLAMSSRNRYLSAEQRTQAPLIYRALQDAQKAWKNGERSKQKLLTIFEHSLSVCPDLKTQYVELVNASDLTDPGEALDTASLVMIVSIILGDVRLIDNLEFLESYE